MAVQKDEGLSIPPVTERYFTQLFTTQCTYVFIHKNELCLVGVTPNHPVLAKPIVNFNWNVGTKDRSQNQVKGKRKTGGLTFNSKAPLVEIESADGTKTIIPTFVAGSLVEINENLKDSPSLLSEYPLSQGYIAIIKPNKGEEKRLRESLMTKEAYQEFCQNDCLKRVGGGQPGPPQKKRKTKEIGFKTRKISVNKRIGKTFFFRHHPIISEQDTGVLKGEFNLIAGVASRTWLFYMNKSRDDTKQMYRSKPFINPVVRLNEDESDLALTFHNSYTISTTPLPGFAFIWSNVRATVGVKKGTHWFEVKVVSPVGIKSEISKSVDHLVRVGWSTLDSPMDFGSSKSFFYCGTGTAGTNGRFGIPFDAGDVIGAYIDCDGGREIRFSVNGKDAGCPFLIPEFLCGSVFFPHIALKNMTCEVNFGFKPPVYKSPHKRFEMIEDASKWMTEQKKPPETCELLILVGLPFSGKTRLALDYQKHFGQEKHEILAVNTLIEKMNIPGLYHDRAFTSRMALLASEALDCYPHLLEAASSRKRNYIIDQPNITVEERAPILSLFQGWEKKALVLMPSNEQIRKRELEAQFTEGKYLRPETMINLKANFTLPTPQEGFSEILFLNQEYGLMEYSKVQERLASYKQDASKATLQNFKCDQSQFIPEYRNKLEHSDQDTTRDFLEYPCLGPEDFRCAMDALYSPTSTMTLARTSSEKQIPNPLSLSLSNEVESGDEIFFPSPQRLKDSPNSSDSYSHDLEQLIYDGSISPMPPMSDSTDDYSDLSDSIVHEIKSFPVGELAYSGARARSRRPTSSEIHEYIFEGEKEELSSSSSFDDDTAYSSSLIIIEKDTPYRFVHRDDPTEQLISERAGLSPKKRKRSQHRGMKVDNTNPSDESEHFAVEGRHTKTNRQNQQPKPQTIRKSSVKTPAAQAQRRKKKRKSQEEFLQEEEVYCEIPAKKKRVLKLEAKKAATHRKEESKKIHAISEKHSQVDLETKEEIPPKKQRRTKTEPPVEAIDEQQNTKGLKHKLANESLATEPPKPGRSVEKECPGLREGQLQMLEDKEKVVGISIEGENCREIIETKTNDEAIQTMTEQPTISDKPKVTATNPSISTKIDTLNALEQIEPFISQPPSLHHSLKRLQEGLISPFQAKETKKKEQLPKKEINVKEVKEFQERVSPHFEPLRSSTDPPTTPEPNKLKQPLQISEDLTQGSNTDAEKTIADPRAWDTTPTIISPSSCQNEPSSSFSHTTEDICWSTIQLQEIVGQGSFGQVWKALWVDQVVAVKRLYTIEPEPVAMFLKEMALMCRLEHENIIKYLGCSSKTPFIFMVMQFAPMTLRRFIRTSDGAMPSHHYIQIAKGIASGMAYLHQHNIIHRDLKPANILLTDDYMAKIADFGISISSEGTSTKTQIGTPTYMAPEVFSTLKYSFKIDVYSFGMILWQMLSGEKPFAGCGPDGADLIPIQFAIKITNGDRPEIPQTCTPQLSKLIADSWHQEPNVRPSFTKTLSILESFSTIYLTSS